MVPATGELPEAEARPELAGAHPSTVTVTVAGPLEAGAEEALTGEFSEAEAAGVTAEAKEAEATEARLA